MIQTKKALKQAQLKESLDALRALSDTDQAALVAARNSAGRGVVMVTGHTPSVRNCAFLCLQSQGRPLSIIGGFRQWEAAGRRVRRGETGYKILVPSQFTRVDDTSGATIDGLYFRFATVFDISQTDEIEGGA